QPGIDSPTRTKSPKYASGCRIPVARGVLLTAAGADMIAMKTILVATDFGEAADAALAYGRALARMFGGTLHLLHVTENQFLRPMIDRPEHAHEAIRRRLNQLLQDEDRRGVDGEGALETSDAPA